VGWVTVLLRKSIVCIWCNCSRIQRAAHGEVAGGLQLNSEDIAIEEEEGIEGLVLGGGGDVPVHGQVGEKGLDFGRAHVIGVALVMEQDVTPDPVQVSGFGANGVMFEADGVVDPA